jgi:acyl carrier protein
MKILNNKNLKKILKETFPLEKIPNNIENLKMGDFNSWDSLGNFNLLLALEKFLKIRFSYKEVTEIRSVDQIIKCINERQS